MSGVALRRESAERARARKSAARGQRNEKLGKIKARLSSSRRKAVYIVKKISNTRLTRSGGAKP
jgi:hypothetical protein